MPPALTAPVTASSPTTVAGSETAKSPPRGYDHDTLTADLDGLLTDLDLIGIALVGLPMGGGEAARYLGTHGDDRADFRGDLDTISVLTLVTRGDSGAILAFEVSGKRTGQSVPGARTVVVGGGPQGST